jgi:hypothetical protein
MIYKVSIMFIIIIKILICKPPLLIPKLSLENSTRVVDPPAFTELGCQRLNLENQVAVFMWFRCTGTSRHQVRFPSRPAVDLF